MSITPNLGLIVTSDVAGSAVTFHDWRLGLTSDTVSNMTIIDNFAGTMTGSMIDLKLNQVFSVDASLVSTNYYEASGVAGISSYNNNMIICLTLDSNNSGSVTTININNIGVNSIYKNAVGGAQQYLSANDMVAGKQYFCRYDSNAWILVYSSLMSDLYVSGCVNNLMAVNSSHQLVDSGVSGCTVSAMISASPTFTQGFMVSGSSFSYQPNINFIAGSSITISGSATGSALNITINSTATGGSSGSSSGGGHIIIDSSGSVMQQENNLKFVGATVTDSSGSTVVTITSGSGGGLTGGGTYDQRVTMWHIDSNVLTGTALRALAVNNSQPYNYAVLQDTGANGDSFTQSFTMSSGSCVLKILGQTGPVMGKIDWFIDNVLAVSGQDWYSAGYVPAVIKTASVTISGNGRHVLKGVINGSTGGNYYFQAQTFVIYPVTDSMLIDGGGSGTIVYPTQIQIPLMFPTDVSGLSRNIVPSQYGYFRWYTTSNGEYGTVDDYIQWPVLLQSGTWKIEMLSDIAVYRGIITAYLDGTPVGTVDCYGGTVANDIKTISGITVATTAVMVLKLGTPTKNGSALGYSMVLSNIVLTKTG